MLGEKEVIRKREREGGELVEMDQTDIFLLSVYREKGSEGS